MIVKQQKRKIADKLVITFALFAFLNLGTTSCSKLVRWGGATVQNDSVSSDSIVASNAVKEKVSVDPSLVKNGDLGYSLYEQNGNEEGVGNNQVQLIYTIEHGKCTNYCGTLYYPNKKNPDEKHEIEVLGEAADDGGLVFKGKLDNVLYAIHIKNTHNTASGGNMQKHEVEMTVGNKTRTIYMIFENAGENGD